MRSLLVAMVDREMRISLLTALPHSPKEIEAARGNRMKDYIRQSLRGEQHSADTIWGQMKDSLGEKADQLFKSCAKQDVQVFRNAGRSELRTAADQSDVVIIVAHWKGSLLAAFPPDLLSLPSEVADRIEHCICERILPDDLPREIQRALSGEKARDLVTDKLNNAIRKWREWLRFEELVGDEVDSLVVSPAYGRGHARVEIDNVFGDEHLIPGSRLELADGLWSPADIAESLGTDWAGICDFFCCTSEYLAEEAKSRHPKALFRADSRLLSPKRIFTALIELVRRLRSDESRDGMSFSERYLSIAFDCNQKYGV